MKSKSTPRPGAALAALPEGESVRPETLLDVFCATLRWAAWGTHAAEQPEAMVDLLAELDDWVLAEALCRLQRDPLRRAQALGRLAQRMAESCLPDNRVALLRAEAFRTLPRSETAAPVFLDLVGAGGLEDGRVYGAAKGWMRACRQSDWISAGHAAIGASLARTDPESAEEHQTAAARRWARHLNDAPREQYAWGWGDQAVAALFAANFAQLAHAGGDAEAAGRALDLAFAAAAEVSSSAANIGWGAVIRASIQMNETVRVARAVDEARLPMLAARLESELTALCRSGRAELARAWVAALSAGERFGLPLAAYLHGRGPTEARLAQLESPGRSEELQQHYQEGLLDMDELRAARLEPARVRAILGDHDAARAMLASIDARDRAQLAERIETAAAEAPAPLRGRFGPPPEPARLAAAAAHLSDRAPTPESPYRARRDWEQAVRLVLRASQGADKPRALGAELLDRALGALAGADPRVRAVFTERHPEYLCAALVVNGRPLQAMGLVDSLAARLSEGSLRAGEIEGRGAAAQLAALAEALIEIGARSEAISVLRRSMAELQRLPDALTFFAALRALCPDAEAERRLREASCAAASELRAGLWLDRLSPPRKPGTPRPTRGERGSERGARRGSNCGAGGGGVAVTGQERRAARRKRWRQNP